MFRLGDSSNLSSVPNDRTYIYYTPASDSEVCNGTVTAVQICYQSKYKNYVNYTFGEFVLLNKNRTHFTVMKNFFLVTHMTANVCVRGKNNIKYICCENITLGSPNQFNISSLDYFGFGIKNTDRNIKPLRFKNKEYVEQQYVETFASTIPPIFIASPISSNSLIILRFLISKYDVFHN